jgi:hypothetical protein
MNTNRIKINYWKWSKGETYYKSPRKDLKEHTNESSSEYGYEEGELTTQQISYDTAQNAIAQSLAFTDINELPNFSRSNDNENKREYLDNKISDRELMAQRGSNPFSLQTSYVNDVVTRDMFLKPINTTQGRTKNQNKTEEE